MSNSIQADLFKALESDPLEAENAPSLDFSLDIIAVVNRCLRNCPLSRDQIVDRVNLCLRESNLSVTKVSLNKWLSPSQANAIPAWVLPALCWAMQSDAPFQILLQPLGRTVIDARGDTMRQMTEMNLDIAAKKREAKNMERAMQQMINGVK